MASAQFGVIGLGVMGQSLSLNIASHSFSVVTWNLERETMQDFIQGRARDEQITGEAELDGFVAALQRPRRILMMIKAGDPVDEMIRDLTPLLDPDDILIDGGNSHYGDTTRREETLAEHGIHFLGMGISGGEEGALKGPSLMPGGKQRAYEEVRPILEKIAAQVEDGPCVTHIGPQGSGHFVKTVHNGIEYGNMQLIAEAYDLMRRLLGLKASELASIFRNWDQGPLNSFLIEITAKIFSRVDDMSGQPLVDLILDKAKQKGTGRWTSEVALELGVTVPTIHAAIESRYISALKDERVHASGQLAGPDVSEVPGEANDFIMAVRDALYCSFICCYAQGMTLIQAASKEYSWDIELSEVSRIWKGGCIIRARLLKEIQEAYSRQPNLENLLLDASFKHALAKGQQNWRLVLCEGQKKGIPCYALSSSLSYYDSYRTAQLPLNLTQAQRDYFGAHRYQRKDKPGQGPFHTDWLETPPSGDKRPS